MVDIGWSELLVIGVVALIVVGPKDLPRMFRTLGEFTGKARRMAREFQNAMNQAADDSGVGDIAGDLRKVANPKKFGMDALKGATDDLKAWTPDEADGKAAPRTASGEYKKPAAAKPDPAAPPPADPVAATAPETPEKTGS